MLTLTPSPASLIQGRPIIRTACTLKKATLCRNSAAKRNSSEGESVEMNEMKDETHLCGCFLFFPPVRGKAIWPFRERPGTPTEAPGRRRAVRRALWLVNSWACVHGEDVAAAVAVGFPRRRVQQSMSARTSELLTSCRRTHGGASSGM